MENICGPLFTDELSGLREYSFALTTACCSMCSQAHNRSPAALTQSSLQMQVSQGKIKGVRQLNNVV